MPRLARLVVPGFPHHVTQRGNRKQRTFFATGDYRAYIDLLAAAKARAEVEILAYCLMPNHVHFVSVPRHKDGLVKLFKEAHRKYTRRINLSHDWRGHLWQERFHSSVMDENHLMSCVRYIELNPVRAGLCREPQDWIWSSANAHLRKADDRLVSVEPMLDRVDDWAGYLEITDDRRAIDRIRRLSLTGRPCGSDDFVLHLERLTGRVLRLKKPGRKASRNE